MSKVFLTAGHSTTVAGAVSQGYNESKVVVDLVNQCVAILSNQDLKGRQLVVVPHNLDLVDSINWINRNTTDEYHDICIEVHMNAGGGTGIEVYYFAGDNTSKAFANELLGPLVAETGLPNRGVKADNTTRFGRLGFIRDTKPLASLVELGFIDTSDLWVVLNKGGMALAKAVLNSVGSTFVDHAAIAAEQARLAAVEEQKRLTEQNRLLEEARKAKEAVEKAEADRLLAEKLAKEKEQDDLRVAEELKTQQTEPTQAVEPVKETNMNVLQRFKSPVVLTALLAQILLVIGYFSPELSDTVKLVGTAIVQTLTIVGILNNPTDPKSF